MRIIKLLKQHKVVTMPQLGGDCEQANPKMTRERGLNKLKVNKNPMLVDVNENLQPITPSLR